MNTARLLLSVVVLIALAPLVFSQQANGPTLGPSDVFPNIVNVGETTLFTATYIAVPNTEVTLYICKNSNCDDCGFLPDKSGCWCYNETPVTSGIHQCTYTAHEEDAYPSGYWVKMDNVSAATGRSSAITSGTDSASFDINTRPEARSVYIGNADISNPDAPTNTSTLHCNYTFFDPEGNTERRNLARFKWFVQEGGSGPFVAVSDWTAPYLRPFHFKRGDAIICTANVTDQHYLESNPGRNSTIITINNTAPVFLVSPIITSNLDNESLGWTASFYDDDGDSVNASLIRWYRNSILQPAYDNQNISHEYTSIGELWEVEITLTDSEGKIGETRRSSGITIQSSGPSIYFMNTTTQIQNATTVGGVVQFTADWNHTGSALTVALFICNQTGVTEGACPAGSRTYCLGDYSSANPATCQYTVQESDPVLNIYYAMVCDSYGACSTESSGQFRRFNDSAMPNASASFIHRNVSGTNEISIMFNVTDDYNLSLSTLVFTIANSTNTTLYLPQESIFFGRGYALGDNLTCSGNATFQSCQMAASLADGRYNLTIEINDSNTNRYMRTQSYIVDTVTPDLENVQDGYIDHSGDVIIAPVVINNHLYSNWTNITSSLSGIDRYEFAIGTNENYGQTGWNSSVGWTSVGVQTHANITLNMQVGASYFFHIRAVNRAGIYSNVSTSPGVVYEDITPPVCTIVYDHGASHPNWTNSLTTLAAWWNFSEPETIITQYEVAIGNATPPGNGFNPLPGFENILPRTQTISTTFTSSSLTLAPNQTYYFSVRAKNSNNAWSSWCYSDGVTVDVHNPYGWSLSYPESYLAYTNITILITNGSDDISGVDQNTGVRLLVAKAPINLVDFTCPSFSSFYHAHLNPPYNPMGVLYNTSPGYCYKFRLEVQDRAGNTITVYSNEEMMDDKVFVTDSTPPIIFEVFDTGHVTYDGSSLSANWALSSDPETGISHYSYAIYRKSKVDGSMLLAYDWMNVSFSTDSVTRGGLNLSHETQYFFYVKAVNRAGLETLAMSNGILYQDRTPPGPLTLIRVEEGDMRNGYYHDPVNDSKTMIVAQGFSSDLSRCVYTLTDTGYYEQPDNSTSCSVQGTSVKNVTCNVSLPTQGFKTVYIYCRDVNGNNQYNEQHPGIPLSVTWVNDWGPPKIIIESPLENSIVGGLVDIDVAIYDQGIGQISHAWYEVKNLTGSIVGSGTLAAPHYQQDWDAFIGGFKGTHTLIVHANDTFGYQANVSANFTINVGIPIVSIYHEKFVNSTQQVRILSQVFTNMSYQILNQSGHVLHYNDSNSTTMRNYLSFIEVIDVSNRSIWPDGIYTIHAEALDNVSNRSESIVHFTIDRVEPKILDVADTASLILYTGDQLDLSFTYQDSVPIASAVIWLNDSHGYSNYSWINGSAQNNLTFSSGYFMLEAWRIPQHKNNKTLTWYIEIKDAAGNRNISTTYEFSVLNSAPTYIGYDYHIEMYEDQLHHAQILFTDIDGDNLTLTAINSSNISIVYINQSILTLFLNSTPDWYGVENITLTATDPSGAQLTLDFTVEVINVNDAPRVSSPIPDIRFEEDSYNQSLNLSDHFYDIDSPQMTFGYQGPNIPSSVSFTFFSSGIVNISSSDDYFGTFFMNFTASDGQYLTPSNTILVNITPVNDPPVLTSVPDYAFNATNDALIVLNATDIDSYGLNLSLNDTRFVKQPDGVTFIWTTNLSDHGIYALNASVHDPEGLSDSQIFHVEILYARDLDGDGIPDFKDDDIDGDGIPNAIDTIIGDSSHIQTNIPALYVTVSGDSNLSQLFTGQHAVVFRNATANSSGTMWWAAFFYDFRADEPFDLTQMSVYSLNFSGRYGVYTSGIHPNGGNRKQIVIHYTHELNEVCVKDVDIPNLNQTNISIDCSEPDEQTLVCGDDPEWINNMRCETATLNGLPILRVRGLQHTIVVQQYGCTDRDGDGYGVGSLCLGPDFDDDDDTLFPGAACQSDSCYSGQTYDTNGDCTGGTYVCGGSARGGGGSGGSSPALIETVPEERCRERWVCTDWTECDMSGAKTRSCRETSNCNTTSEKPLIYQACTYWEVDSHAPKEPTCNDGIQNQDEVGIDCGGPCAPCPTCFDGIQNQGEFGIDCGGPCRPCVVPEPEAPTPRTIIKDSYKKFLIPGIGVIIALSLLSMVFYRRSQILLQAKEAEFWIKEEAGHILYYKRFDQKIFNKLVQLRVYVRKQMLAGIARDDIKKELLSLGWKEAMIEESFLLSKYVSLELWVRNKLLKGLSKDEIRLELLKIGWPEKDIEDIFMLNTLIQVEIYIRKRIQHGEDPHIIKQHMMEAGWKPKTVEQLFSLNILLDLEIFINKQLTDGKREQEIRSNLVRIGWPHETVDEAITFCKLTR